MTETVKGKAAHVSHDDPKTKAQKVAENEKAPHKDGSPTTKI